MGCCKSKDKVEQPKQTTVQRSENTEPVDDIQVNRRVNIKSDFEANRERDREREKTKKDKEKSPEKEKKPSPKKKSKLPHQQQEEEEEEEEHEEKPKKVAEMEVVRKVESEQAKNQRLKIAAANAKLISTTEERHENLQSLLMLLQETLEENSNEHGEIDDIVKALEEEGEQTENLLRVIETSKANVDQELLKSTTEFAQTVRQLKSEHTSYKQKKNDFRGFKRNILTFLNQQHPDLFMIEEEEDEHIDPNQPPNQTSNRTPSKSKIKSRSKLDQVVSDKSMSLREKSITLVQKSLTSPRGSNLMISPDKSILRSPERQTIEEVEPEIPKKVTPYDEAFDREMALYMEKERDDAVFALESAVNEYNRLVEDFNRMKEQKRTLKNEHMATQLEVRELKENNRDMLYNNETIDMENGTYKGLQGDMLMGYNQVQESCKMLQNELEGMYRRQQQNQVDSQHANVRYDELSRALEQEIMEKHREAEELNKRYQENMNGFLTKENQIQQQRTLMHEQIDMQIEASNLGYLPPIFSQNYMSQQIPVYNYEVEAPRKSMIYEREIPVNNNGYEAGFDRTMKASYPSGVEFYQSTLKKRYSPVRRVNEEEEENMNLQGVSAALDQSRQIRLSPKRVGEDLEAKRMEMQGSNYVGNNHVGSRMSTVSGTYGSGSVDGNIGDLNGYSQGNGYNSNLNGYSNQQYNGQYESNYRFKGENSSQMDRRSNKYMVDVV